MPPAFATRHSRTVVVSAVISCARKSASWGRVGRGWDRSNVYKSEQKSTK